jgi:hypothetical protein
LSNITRLCKFRDDNRTNQFINTSYVISRDKAEGITNFSESGIEDFVYYLNRIGVNNIKFRFDFCEKSKPFMEYVTRYIKSLSDSGKYYPTAIHIQQPKVCPKFKYCLAPFIWPVLGPDIRIYACPHSIRKETEAYYKGDSVPLMNTDNGPLCNFTCQPFMVGLNKIFNNDMEEHQDLQEAVRNYSYSKTIYPISELERRIR